MLICAVVIDAGEQVTDTDVIVQGGATVTVVLPDAAGSCTEIAMIVAVPTTVGVNTPEEVIVPPVAVQFTAGL